MAIGLGTALGEITLVLFTTMAPAGTFALMIMGAFALKGGVFGRRSAPPSTGSRACPSSSR